MKKRIVFVFFLLVSVTMLANIYTAAEYIFNDKKQAAAVSFNVSDFGSGLPVGGACVFIPETGSYYYTDENGDTPLAEIAFTPDPLYDDICKRNFGEITVIVYKEGYADYILCNLCLKDKEKREGVRLLIYKKNPYAPDFTPIVETPDEKWLKELIDKYRK